MENSFIQTVLSNDSSKITLRQTRHSGVMKIRSWKRHRSYDPSFLRPIFLHNFSTIYPKYINYTRTIFSTWLGKNSDSETGDSDAKRNYEITKRLQRNRKGSFRLNGGRGGEERERESRTNRGPRNERWRLVVSPNERGKRVNVRFLCNSVYPRSGPSLCPGIFNSP